MYLGCNSDTSVSSGAILFIKLGIKEVQEEVLVGFLSIVSLLGAVAAGWIADAVGRRWTMAVTAIFFLVGALVSVLMLGRVLGVGFALMIASFYTAEPAPSSSHGSLVSLPGIFINCGILFGYIVSFCLSGLAAHLSWCLMLGAGAVPAICLSLAVLLIMPESLCWLVIQNCIQEAEQMLLKTSHDKAEANDHLVEITEAAGLMGSKLDAQNLGCMVSAEVSPCMWFALKNPTPLSLFLFLYVSMKDEG
jgi:MFS family permease